MATNQDIIAAVKARLDTVANIGTTHAYERWQNNWSDYLNQFKTTIGGVVQIRGWVVTLDAAQPISGEPYSMGNTRRTYRVHIFGVLGLDDSANTEQTFLNLVETVMNDLDGRKNLGVSGAIDYSVGPSSMTRYEIRSFGNVLCHYGEIVLTVEVERAVTYA